MVPVLEHGEKLSPARFVWAPVQNIGIFSPFSFRSVFALVTWRQNSLICKVKVSACLGNGALQGNCWRSSEGTKGSAFNKVMLSLPAQHLWIVLCPDSGSLSHGHTSRSQRGCEIVHQSPLGSICHPRRIFSGINWRGSSLPSASKPFSSVPSSLASKLRMSYWGGNCPRAGGTTRGSGGRGMERRCFNSLRWWDFPVRV